MENGDPSATTCFRSNLAAGVPGEGSLRVAGAVITLFEWVPFWKFDSRCPGNVSLGLLLVCWLGLSPVPQSPPGRTSKHANESLLLHNSSPVWLAGHGTSY